MKTTLLFLLTLLIAKCTIAQNKLALNASIKYDQVKPQKLGNTKLDKEEVITIGIEAVQKLKNGSSINAKLNFPIGKRSATFNYITQERTGPFNSIASVNNYMHIDVNFIADLGLYYDFFIWEPKNCCCDADKTAYKNGSLSLSLGGGASFYNPKNDVGITSSKSGYVPFKQNLNDAYFNTHKMDFDIDKVNFNLGGFLNYSIKNKKTGKTKLILSYGMQRYFNNYFRVINTATGKKTGFAETNTLTVQSFGIKMPIIN